MYISSADWMGRNLDSRIEVTCPIYDKKIRREINEFLEVQWMDNTKARILDSTHENRFKKPKINEKSVRAQFALYDYYHSKLEEEGTFEL